MCESYLSLGDIFSKKSWLDKKPFFLACIGSPIHGTKPDVLGSGLIARSEQT